MLSDPEAVARRFDGQIGAGNGEPLVRVVADDGRPWYEQVADLVAAAGMAITTEGYNIVSAVEDGLQETSWQASRKIVHRISASDLAYGVSNKHYDRVLVDQALDEVSKMLGSAPTWLTNAHCPLTFHTFDCGVIGYGNGWLALIWVVDED